MRFFILAVWFALGGMAFASSTNEVPHTYPSGFSIAIKLGSEIYESLSPAEQQKVFATPVSLDPMDMPMITPSLSADDDNKPLRQVSASVGFIDLLNHIAHAKAIDRIEPGYFQKYVLSLAATDTNSAIPEVPNISDPRFWSEDVMNDQLSFFNQMFGLTIAINLSHHCTGAYEKHLSQLQSRTCPINNLLTKEEWDAAFRAGALTSLRCAFGFEGVHALLDAFGKMGKRPAWADFFIPRDADLKKLNADLTQWETDFFHGKFK